MSAVKDGLEVLEKGIEWKRRTDEEKRKNPLDVEGEVKDLTQEQIDFLVEAHGSGSRYKEVPGRTRKQRWFEELEEKRYLVVDGNFVAQVMDRDSEWTATITKAGWMAIEEYLTASGIVRAMTGASKSRGSTHRGTTDGAGTT